MSSNNTPRSLPIPIENRRRSESSSESSSEASNSPASPLPSPISGTLPRIAPISPSTSPILSYFLAQSPKSQPSSTFPFRRGMTGPLFEDDDAPEADRPAARHARRASSAAWPGQLPQQPLAPMPVPQQERAAGLLRRLSLGGNMARASPMSSVLASRVMLTFFLQPPLPALKPVTTTSAQAPRSTTPPGMKSTSTGMPRKARRANTIAPGTPRPPRAPSPMGERILKGHFDGFN